MRTPHLGWHFEGKQKGKGSFVAGPNFGHPKWGQVFTDRPFSQTREPRGGESRSLQRSLRYFDQNFSRLSYLQLIKGLFTQARHVWWVRIVGTPPRGTAQSHAMLDASPSGWSFWNRIPQTGATAFLLVSLFQQKQVPQNRCSWHPAMCSNLPGLRASFYRLAWLAFGQMTTKPPSISWGFGTTLLDAWLFGAGVESWLVEARSGSVP